MFAFTLSYPPKVSTAPKISSCTIANPQNTYILTNGVLRYWKSSPPPQVFYFNSTLHYEGTIENSTLHYEGAIENGTLMELHSTKDYQI